MKAMRRLCSVSIAIALLSGCLVHPPLTGPTGGGAAWNELTSQHVQLRTDLDAWSAASALDDFEVSAVRLGAMLSMVLARARVILFRDERDYRALIGEEWSGAKYHHQSEDGIIILFLLDNWIYMQPLVRDQWQHEYTHALVHAVSIPPLQCLGSSSGTAVFPNCRYLGRLYSAAKWREERTPRSSV
jgi:hypothetical protein